MPDNHQQQFDKDRAGQAQRSEQDKAGQAESTQRPVAPPEPVAFPWEMLCWAGLFDLVGLVPILNFFTEVLAGLIFGLWQKFYVPKLDPLLTFIVAKIIDIMFLGLLPSNIGIVVYSYIKKKSLQTAESPIGQMALKKVSLPEAQQT